MVIIPRLVLIVKHFVVL
jgi:N-alpha-acetyltransferase 50